jgi:hypothetical protein
VKQDEENDGAGAMQGTRQMQDVFGRRNDSPHLL